MSQVFYEHPAHTTAAADLRHRNLSVAAASSTIMAAGSDPEPIEQPVATGDAKSHQSHSSSHHTTATHYIGLPYQDHNYGAPPPPTPPQSPPPVVVPAAPIFSAGFNGILDVGKPVAVPNLILPAISTPVPVPVDQAQEGETRCICNFTHDDGYMICCDQCGVWQHVDCMGLDRTNIPDTFFCEKCQPRPVDRIRAHELQSKKRPLLINSGYTKKPSEPIKPAEDAFGTVKALPDSSSDSGDDDPSTAPPNTTYMAISNSPTSLTLTTAAAKHKKLKKKKKKRSKEKELDDKHHKRKKRKHSRKPSTKSEGDAPSSLQLMDEEAQQPWSDDTEDHPDRFEEAAFNQYSADIQHLVATHCQKQAPSINSIRQPKLRTLGQRAEFGKLGKSGVGLVATEELKKNEFVIEYKGKVMLSKQLDKLPFFNSPNPHVLMYSKFSKMDICIDANSYGNEARYVRRSCNPNAEVRHSFEDSTIHLSLYSLGHIIKGSEITVGFDYNYKACSFPVRCACKKKNCVIKKLRRKHHSEDGQNHMQANHHITRDEFNKATSNPERLTVATISKKRTVSPLRVSLSAHNAQNNAQPEAAPAPLNGDDTTTPETSKTEAGIEENQESAEEEEPAPQSAKKLTREERKMEAIMKAIEKMEKTEKRRQQALERIATTKQQHDDEKKEGESAEDPKSEETPSKDPSLEGQEEVKKELQVHDDSEQGKSNSASEGNPAGSTTPVTPAKPRPNNRRRKKSAASRRRSRVNSAASTTTLSGAEFSSMDEESNSMAPSTSSISTPSTSSSGNDLLTMAASRTSTSGIDLLSRGSRTSTSGIDLLTRTPRASMLGNDLLTRAARTSTSGNDLLSRGARTPTSTATSNTCSLSMTSPMSGLIPEQQPISSPMAACSKHFKFPKTKKFFMNEWLNEKALEASANKPLTIKTESLDVLATSVSSPNTPTQLSKSASFTNLSTPLCKTNLEGSLSGSLGSAKKRWLRQAMCDSNMKSNNGSSGANSPVLNGTLSPLHPASPALSPNTSLNESMMTPLKKRMLRHSIAEDRSTLFQSSTPPPVIEKPSTAPSTPIPENNIKLLSDETPKETSDVVVKEEVEESTGVSLPSRVELSFGSHMDEKRRAVPYPLSLPARKDIRKNSSLDSGLSVTTPGDLDRSPISVTVGDSQTLVENSCGKTVPIVECKDSSEVKSEERTSERTTICEVKKELPSVEEQNETPVKDERTAKERHKSGDIESPVTKAEPLVKPEGPPAIDIQTPVRQPPAAGAISSTAQVRLDFSLSESQGSLSSLERSQGSMPDLHSSCASSPELRQTLPAAAEKANLSQSASSANFDWTPVKKADVHANVYSTPPRTRWDKIREEDLSKVNGDLPHPRMRHQSGPGDFRRRHLSETETIRRTSESGPGFSDDQISGTTNLYTSFASPKKKTLMMMRNSEALAQEQKQRLDNVEASDTRTSSKLLPNRTESESIMDSSVSQTLQPSEPSVASRLSPAPSLCSNAPQTLVSGQTSLSASPTAGSTPPGPPTLSPHRAFSPARSSSGVSPIMMNSPSKLSMSPVPGSMLSPGSSCVSPVAAVVSPTPGTPLTPQVKKKVSLLEYRKRKTSSAGKTSSPSISSTTTTTSSTTVSSSAPTTPIKPTVPSTTKTGIATLPTLPIFDLKAKAVAEEATQRGRRLSLTTDAVQAITSLTSFLKDKTNPDEEEPTQDDNWRSNKVTTSDSTEDPLQKLRKELNEKNKERERRDSQSSERRESHNSERRDSHNSERRDSHNSERRDSHNSERRDSNNSERRDSHNSERRDSHNSLKRPRSPEPPPPPPSKKKPSSNLQPPAKKSNSGLRLQIPPPPPPKAKSSSESRSGNSSTESTPTKHVMNRPNLHRSPGSASTPPPARKPSGVPGTPPVRPNHGVPGTPPVRLNPGIPGTPPVLGQMPATPPVQARPPLVLGNLPATPPVQARPPVLGNMPATPPVQARLQPLMGIMPATPPVQARPPVLGNMPATPPVQARLQPLMGNMPVTPPVQARPQPLMGNMPATPPVQARPNAMQPTAYPQAPAQAYNPNYTAQQQQPQQQAAPIQYQHGVPQHPQYAQQVAQPAQVPQQPILPQQPPGLPPQQQQVIPQTVQQVPQQQQVIPQTVHQQQPVQQQPPPPPPQQAYNYQGYVNQQQQPPAPQQPVYPEKQGTAAVIEQFTKFHNQQQQQQQATNQQYQHNVYNAAYQQASNYQAAPQQQQPYPNPGNQQQHYNAQQQQQQHVTSNSYSPRRGGYYQ